MNKFKELFAKSRNEPITYKGKRLCLIDHLDVNKNDKLKIKILSKIPSETHSFSIYVEEGKNKKYLELNGVRLAGIPFHEAVHPKDGVEVIVLQDNVRLVVENRGSFIWAWPMIVEQKANKRTYYCNGEDPDEKFDDLVFEIEIIEAQE